MKTIFTRLVLIFSLAVCAFALGACGNKGPLVPPKAATVAVTNSNLEA